jgi:GT2 family glycosyltransferase
MIHYISPFRQDKNIGKAINDAITQLSASDEDWVIHIDQDVLWLLPDSKSRLERILSTTEYDILGAVTNRLSMPYQLASNMFDETDIKRHIEVAKLLDSDVVEPYMHILAAFCLCFKVKTWKQLGGFEDNSISFDTTFSLKAQMSGLKLGLCVGVYVFHLYRMLSDNPTRDIKHFLS